MVAIWKYIKIWFALFQPGTKWEQGREPQMSWRSHVLPAKGPGFNLWGPIPVSSFNTPTLSWILHGGDKVLTCHDLLLCFPCLKKENCVKERKPMFRGRSIIQRVRLRGTWALVIAYSEGVRTVVQKLSSTEADGESDRSSGRGQPWFV